MSLFITSLNSGSNGNCYYVGNEHDAILVDAGISCREIERRMARLDLSMSSVKALFISHEHTDHISGAAVLSRKYRLPVYITPSTIRQAKIHIEKSLQQTFIADEAIQIGSLSVTPFVKHHDAIDPFSFMISYNDIKVGVITDIGKVCERVIHYFRQCHACFLETNYDEKMLDEGGYPIFLKQRIRGGKGHISNAQALELFLQHKPAFMSHLLLSHLSKHNNCPELVLELFKKHAENVKVVVASRYQETEVYTITKEINIAPEIPRLSLREENIQMTLFG
ncbi:MAG: MBL fold metallo-hydrolase [Chitinophagales bacterium]|nr:MBL fold metallo-hydrolase [Chitinophagales bacterium]